MGLLDHFHDFPIEEEPEQAPSKAPANDLDATPASGSRISFTEPDGGGGGAPSQPAPRRRRGCGVMAWILFAIVAGLGLAFYVRYYVPYISEAQERGYVLDIQKRGILFKTFEGELVRQHQLRDTAAVYMRDFDFTVADDSLARVLQRYAGTPTPVVVTYKRYYGTLPWRGASRNVVTAVRR